MIHSSSSHFVLGIDISKKKFDVALLLPNGKRKNKVFQNTPPGFNTLIQWLHKWDVQSLHACMEATNIYGNALAEFLYDEGFDVSVINPARIKGFAQSELLRTKTDAQDASLIARFCQAMQPSLWQPEPVSIRQLKAMVKRLDALIGMQQQEVNRLDVAESVIQTEIQSHIEQLNLRIQQLRQDIRSHIDNDPDLKHQNDLLLSIPGIGEKTIACLLAHFHTITRFDQAKKLAAFCGVTPRERQLGNMTGHARMSKTGSAHLRKALFFPAMVALRYNPVLIQLNQRLTAKGKPKMLIIGAAMRKLVHIIYGVLKNNTPFNPNLIAENP